MIENIMQWDIVKYIGSLVNPKTLGKRFDKIMELYESNELGLAAKQLFIWVIIIIIVATIIDQVFYWIRPEQRFRLLKALSFLRKYKKILLDKIKQIKSK